jgi:sugar phosphate isomerase/epimerase
VTDPAMLRAVLRVTAKAGYDWVECNSCDYGWQVAHFAESAESVG